MIVMSRSTRSATFRSNREYPTYMPLPPRNNLLTVHKHRVENAPNVRVAQNVPDRQRNRRTKQLQHVNQHHLVLTAVRRLETAARHRLQQNADGRANVHRLLRDIARLEKGVQCRQHGLHDGSRYGRTLQHHNEGVEQHRRVDLVHFYASTSHSNTYRGRSLRHSQEGFPWLRSDWAPLCRHRTAKDGRNKSDIYDGFLSPAVILPKTQQDRSNLANDNILRRHALESRRMEL